MAEIKRRKPALPAPAASNSGGDDMGSTSTSSPDSKNLGTVETTSSQVANLSGENEKLRKDNEILSNELAQAKKQCEELINYLKEHVKMGPDQIQRIMRQGSCGSSLKINGQDDDEKSACQGESLKLFGVKLNISHNNRSDGTSSNKRGREDQVGCGGPHSNKQLKSVDFVSPVMIKSSKVCN